VFALFDTHAHLDQTDFDEDRDAVIQRARVAGVATMLAVGVTAESSRRCLAIAQQHAVIFATAAIHPNYLAEASDGDFAVIEELSRDPRVVAIGETGLDRHWDFTPFEAQLESFDRHMRLAHERGLPFIVHMRDCEADIMASLRAAHAERGPLSGIMHSFTGDAAMAAGCMELGMHISFAGMVTYKKSQALRDCAATIPDDRLLVETDSPYLSPEPVRGIRRNEPAHVRHTAECLARVRGVTVEAIAALTTANARKLFRIPEPGAAES
jgi:TatD DNase family protein